MKIIILLQNPKELINLCQSKNTENLWEGYIRIFTHFLEIAILNSYAIYSRQCKKNRISPISRTEFHYKIAKDLLKEWRLIKNISDTPRKLRGNNKVFYSPEELLINRKAMLNLNSKF